MKNYNCILTLLFIIFSTLAQGQDTTEHRHFCTTKSTPSVYLRFADGSFRLHRSKDSLITKKEALIWKVISFHIAYTKSDSELVEWSYSGQQLNKKLVADIRKMKKDSLCLVVKNIRVRSLYTGEVMTLPSACLYLPLKDPIDPAKTGDNHLNDPPDTVIFISSPRQLAAIARNFEKKKMGFFYEYSSNHNGTTYSRGFGKIIWYILKTESNISLPGFGTSRFLGINRIVTKKYYSLL